MMAMQSLLYRREVAINEHISIRIPLVGEIIDNEDEYYGLVSLLTAMPIDMMVQLDDMGIDFVDINEYDLFLLLFGTLREQDTSLIFGDLDLGKFQPAVNEQNGEIILVDEQSGVRIDRAIHGMIADALRKVHQLEKNIRKPGNAAAREYLIERARKKMARRKKNSQDSHLESLIVALVNSEQCNYSFAGIRELTIYQFNRSVRQVIRKNDYNNVMHGVYAGTVSTKDLSQDELNWITNKTGG